jgi:hypothetical protein
MTIKTDLGQFPFTVVSIEIFLSTIDLNKMPLTCHLLPPPSLHEFQTPHPASCTPVAWKFHNYKKKMVV